MKRFISFVFTLTITFFFFSDAQATHRSWNRSTVSQDAGFYVGASGGFNNLNDSSLESVVNLDVQYGPGFSFGGIFGYDFGIVRVDTEINYRKNDIDQIGISADGSTSALSFMVNGYFDIPTHMVLQPYLGAGLGFATVSINEAIVPGVAPVADDSDSVFAYQLSAGIGFELSQKTTLSFGYRYFATGDPEMQDVSGIAFSTEYQSHEFNIGVRFLF